jgi:cell wall-associated NlpC family hydrolase
MPKKRGLSALLKAAFIAGFSVGKSAKYWGRVWTELKKRAAFGPWRTQARRTVKKSAGRRGSAKQPSGGWNFSPMTLGVIVIISIVFGMFAKDMGKYLPAQLLVSQSELEADANRDKFVSTAMKYIGYPYVYSEENPAVGFDCSGFVYWSLQESLSITHPARASRDMYAYGDDVPLNDLKKGDLVFMDTGGSGGVDHVGIVSVDGGSRFVHSDSYKGKVLEEPLQNSWFWPRIVGARRILTVAQAETPAPAEPPEDYTPPEDYDYYPPSDESRPLDEIVPVAAGPFPDVDPGHPYAPSIALLKDRQVIGGYADGTFKPDRVVSRVELLKFAFLAYNIAPTVQSSDYTDVPATHWGQSYIATATQRGWVSGYGDGRWGPDNPVTKAEASKILINISGLPYEDPTRKPLFYDTPRDSWMAPFVAEVKALNLMDSATSFYPNTGMNRAAVAEFVVRVLRSQGKA